MAARSASLTRSASLVLLAALVAACGAPGSETPGDDFAIEVAPGGEKYVAGELLVGFHPGALESAKADAFARVGAFSKERLVSEAWLAELGTALPSAAPRDGGEIELAALPANADLWTSIAEIAAHPAVRFVEPNWVYEHRATSNDPYVTNGSLWGVYGDASSPANAYGSGAAEAWAAGNVGSDAVYVGVIDEGVMYAHEDLAANHWVNPFDPANGVDDDGNGYVDDVRGWDFDGNNNSTFDGTNDDHGTHVAGTIGAAGGNGKGIAGVSWNVTIITAKFLGRRGGTTANAIKAVDYMTDLKLRHGLNLVATNNSWGGGGFSQGLYDAIERANAADILFVAAAGNGGGDGVGDDNDTTPHYPSSYTNDNIISVASITKDGAKSGFSNYGATSVDLGAPGSAIYSTVPGRRNSSGYASYSGTSMATPHVTGAAALYAASHPGSTAAQIKAAILNGATPTASLAGKTVTGGRLNADSF